MKVILDIETDGFNPSKIHCIVAKNVDTNLVTVFDPDTMYSFNSWAKKVDKFIMHNGLSFDAPVLNRLLGTGITPDKIIDTLILSQLFNPIREKGHSLRAWGEKLNMLKGGEDVNFSKYDFNMLNYCKQDVEITHAVYNELVKESNGFSQESSDLEHNIRLILDQQEKNGFAFDMMKAQQLLAKLKEDIYDLEQWSLEEFEPTIVEMKTKTKEIPFNIGSRQQIADRLMKKGWKPKQFTDKKNIIINEAVLKTIKEPELKLTAERFSKYFLLQKRAVMVESWIDACDNDNRVHGKVMTLRTITGRMAHNSPNMAQVPAVYSPYGKDCRGLWTISDPMKYKLVGTDASGLELRCLAHYLNDTTYTDEILNGDIHTKNMELAGLANRDQAKTFIYAFLYGAGAEKIGKIVGAGKEQGNSLIKRFLSNLPSLRRLREQVESVSRRGKIKAIDGRYLKVRSPHSALNTLLQGAGAIVCKQWLLHIITRVYNKKLDAKLVASVHDEYQFEVANKDVNEFCSITKIAMKETEKTLKLRCPLDNDYKVGVTWAETH
jgi:DNA polymerase-1|tara:strand:+ start:709 stop:2355 length:1647 start_codon:yes stop_codon:yes gene_type:complete